MNRLAPLAMAGFMVIAVAGTVPVKASVTGCGAPPRKTNIERFDVRTTTALYGFSESGSFYRAEFNGTKSKRLAAHTFDGSVHFTRSADGRLLAYSGSLKRGYRENLGNHTTDQLWLYDLATGRNELVLESPAWSLAGVKASFSPDARWLATTVDPDSRHPKFKRHGLVLIDTQSGRRKHLGYPPGTDKANGVFSDAVWQKTGGNVLFTVGTARKRRYFSVNPASGEFTQIEGYYDRTKYEHVYVSHGKSLAQQTEYSPQSRLGYSASRTTGRSGSWEATIDGQYRLWLRGGSGPRKLLGSGAYEQCAGVTIAIKGWIGNGDYLIYSISEVPYIADTKTLRRKPLKLGPIGVLNYFW